MNSTHSMAPSLEYSPQSEMGIDTMNIEQSSNDNNYENKMIPSIYTTSASSRLSSAPSIDIPPPVIFATPPMIPITMKSTKKIKKRERGRPRKIPLNENDDNTPKRGRGRPRKIPLDGKDNMIKRGRGRPRKNKENSVKKENKEN